MNEKSKCPEDEHDPDEERVCRRCGWAVCIACGRAFDLMCDTCDDSNDYMTDAC